MSAPICPRCGHYIPNDVTPGEYPGAISRWDNKTEVCSQCGTDEALLQYMAHLAGENPSDAVHPERRPWVRPHATA